MIRFGSLFAGIGGMDLGLERAGMQCAWQVEIDPYATAVLQKHWPHIPKFPDVRTFAREDGARESLRVDLICGGFPCQDISNAGKRVGITGERSGLWTEFARVIRILRPRYVLVENVAALLVRGMDVVLGDLSACGYDAEWRVLSACEFGLPHIRQRLFLVAYPTAKRWSRILCDFKPTVSPAIEKVERSTSPLDSLRGTFSRLEQELGEPSVFGTSHGIPNSSHRLGGLGNAVVPQVAEYVGRQIIAFDAARNFKDFS